MLPTPLPAVYRADGVSRVDVWSRGTCRPRASSPDRLIAPSGHSPCSLLHHTGGADPRAPGGPSRGPQRVVARLPTSPRWRAVAGLLDAPAARRRPASPARRTLAAERRLRQLRSDPSLAYCFWLLTRLAAAARGPDFARRRRPARHPGRARRHGAAVRRPRRRPHPGASSSAYPESGPFGEIASLALRRALAETVGTQGRSLFGSSLEDLETAFRRHSTPTQFGDLAHRFFGDFMARDAALLRRPGAAPRGRRRRPAARRRRDRRSRGRSTSTPASWRASSRSSPSAGTTSGTGSAWAPSASTTRAGFVAHALPKLRGAVVRAGAR